MTDSPSSPNIGTWLALGSPAIAELAALAGFSWVLIDLEHGCATESEVPDQLRALRGTSTEAIVRVGAPYPDLIGRVLDWGARGIMVPHVDDAATAHRIVQATRYPPQGHRGVSRTTRATGYGLHPSSPGALPPLVMAQIETVKAVHHAAEIAQVDGVDVLFVGPADLQYDLTHGAQAATAPGDFAHCLTLVAEAAAACGKEAGILLRDLGDVSIHLDLGFTRIAVDSDLGILRKAYQHTLSNLPR
jgi:2-dehydro-3-deoxyglucarate aldolase/4-hydroxy-2-oxoheptanedioate aldolase